MNKTWAEIRTAAAVFARDHADDRDEQRDTHTFWNDFFANIFGVNRRRVAVYEQSVTKIGGAKGRIDLFWPGELIIEQKSLGRDLFGAKNQALDYTHNLTDAEMPKLILTCDFRSWQLTDLVTNETTSFLLSDLPKHVEKFAFALGRQTVRYKDQDPANIKAAELVGSLHDEIRASGYSGHKLEVFLTRIVFCLFADDTGIFDRDILSFYLENRTAKDGHDVGGKIGQLFNTLNTPVEERQTTLDPDLNQFPYVNGHLFAEHFAPPDFNASMHAALLSACRFDWTPISPAIFGSLFQSVMDKAERRKKGAHYTTEKNIQKLIGPLFLDDLRAEFERLKALKSARVQRLTAFHDKIASLTFFDPACGCGNFLIIAYRELRRLEHDLLSELHKDGQLKLDATVLSRVDVDQFYGIELEEFPARIAETALWMMDHLMNRELSERFGKVFLRIPLKKAPHIVIGDALELDWAGVLEPERCSYVFGNPPFVGAKFQSVKQREQVRGIANLGKSGGTLDFVAAWFLKAGAYVQGATRIAFVATNSVTQGEQVAQLWPLLFDRCKLEIAFAHRTFAWGSDARGKAQVHVVILGLDRRENARGERRLFSYPDIKGDPVETVQKAISPYLFDAGGLKDAHTVVRASGDPLSTRNPVKFGNMPNDGGHLILSKSDASKFIELEPKVEPYVRRLIGAHDFMGGEERYCLWLVGAGAEIINKPIVRERLLLTRQYRLLSTRATTVELAGYPSLFGEIRQTTTTFLLLPRHGSDGRNNYAVGFFDGGQIVHDSCLFMPEPTMADFALLSSHIHMAWIQAVGGKIKSDYRYSVNMVYNTFPLPSAWDAKNGAVNRTLQPLAQAVLDARSEHPSTTLATLYDPIGMPPNLRKAHGDLDRAVDRLYRPSGFASDRERVEHLFGLYEAMVTPLLVKKGKRGRRK